MKIKEYDNYIGKWPTAYTSYIDYILIVMIRTKNGRLTDPLYLKSNHRKSLHFKISVLRKAWIIQKYKKYNKKKRWFSQTSFS